MDELIKELTLFAKAARRHIERLEQAEEDKKQPELPFVGNVQEPKPKRKKKEETPVEVSAAAQPEMTEEESRAKLYKISSEFVNQDESESNRAARRELAIAHMGATWKVGLMKSLPHAERLEFIGWFEKMLKSSVTPAGV